jgi:hypothetical protein
LQGSGRGCLPLTLETLTAEYRPSLRGPEWDGGVLAALRTRGPSLYLGWALSGWGRSQNGHASSFAGFAPLGFIGELLVVKEQLLAGRKNKIGFAVNALQHPVLEFH